MNNIIKRVWNRNRMVNIEDLRGMAFQAESGGHTFEIYGTNDSGATVPLSGAITGVFLRPDNTDVAITGSVVNGVARVTFTQACYAVPGRFGFTIFTDGDGLKTCVYACVGTVSRTSSGTVAGDTPANVADLVNAINAAIASIPADYSDLMTAIAPTYSNTALYAVGSYAWYDGVLYKCTTAITTAELWTAAHWTAAVLGNDVADLKSAFDDLKADLYDSDGSVQNATIYTSEWVSGWWALNGTAATKNAYWRHKVPFILMTKGTVVKVDASHVAVVCLSANDSTGIDGGRYELGHSQSITLESDYYVRVAIGTDGTTNISGYTSEQVNSLKAAVTFSDVVETAKWVSKTELEDELAEYAKKDDIPDLVEAQAGEDAGIVVHIPNDTGSTIPNATIKLQLHKGTQTGATRWNEIFSTSFKNKFWNVRPTATNDDPLTFDLHSSDRVEFIMDESLASDSTGLLHFADGTLCKALSGNILVSEDNGATWTDTGLDGEMGYIDSTDRLFINTGAEPATIMMYEKDNWSSGIEVLNFEAGGAPLSTSMLRWCEDDQHNIYYGLYRVTWGAKIYKLADEATSMSLVYETDDGQHVHSIFWDDATKTIYCGIDNSNTVAGPINIYSTDRGANWTAFTTVPYRASDAFGNGIFDGTYYGSGEAAVLGGASLYSTIDPLDSTKYKTLIDTHQLIRAVRKVGNILLAYGGGNKQALYPQIFISYDNGDTWDTAFAGDLAAINTATVTTGTLSFVTDYFTPKGATEKQIISTGMTGTYGVRTFVGDKNYHALMFVNVGDIPVGGKDIILHTDYIVSGTDIAKSYNYTATPTIDVTFDNVVAVNGTEKTVTGDVDYLTVPIDSYNGLDNPKNENVCLAKLNVASSAKIGGVSISSLFGTTFELYLKSPNPTTYKTMGKAAGKEYILSSGTFGLYVKSTSPVGFVFDVNGTEVNVLSLTPVLRYSSPDQMVRITMTIDSEGGLALYANGGKYETATISSDYNLSTAGDFYIGKASYSSGEGAYSYGIAGIKIYDYAMSEREVYMRFAKRNYV